MTTADPAGTGRRPARQTGQARRLRPFGRACRHLRRPHPRRGGQAVGARWLLRPGRAPATCSRSTIPPSPTAPGRSSTRRDRTRSRRARTTTGSPTSAHGVPTDPVRTVAREELARVVMRLQGSRRRLQRIRRGRHGQRQRPAHAVRRGPGQLSVDGRSTTARRGGTRATSGSATTGSSHRRGPSAWHQENEETWNNAILGPNLDATDRVAPETTSCRSRTSRGSSTPSRTPSATAPRQAPSPSAGTESRSPSGRPTSGATSTGCRPSSRRTPCRRASPGTCRSRPCRTGSTTEWRFTAAGTDSFGRQPAHRAPPGRRRPRRLQPGRRRVADQGADRRGRPAHRRRRGHPRQAGGGVLRRGRHAGSRCRSPPRRRGSWAR